MIRCIQSNEPIHIILDGAPASAKSMFLLSMKDGLEKTYFVALIDYIYKKSKDANSPVTHLILSHFSFLQSFSDHIMRLQTTVEHPMVD